MSDLFDREQQIEKVNVLLDGFVRTDYAAKRRMSKAIVDAILALPPQPVQITDAAREVVRIWKEGYTLQNGSGREALVALEAALSLPREPGGDE